VGHWPAPARRGILVALSEDIAMQTCLQRIGILAAAGAVALTAACGDDGSSFEAIYQVDAWTENAASCDDGGESVLESKSQTMFYVKLENFIGTEFLNVKFCDDQADCEMLAGDDETIFIGEFGFETGNDNGWTAGYFSGFPDNDDVCQGNWVETTLAPNGEAGVIIEERRTPAGGFAPDSDGFCDDEPGKQAAQGQPCAELERLTATEISGL
jgi:hypothetical protein